MFRGCAESAWRGTEWLLGCRGVCRGYVKSAEGVEGCRTVARCVEWHIVVVRCAEHVWRVHGGVARGGVHLNSPPQVNLHSKPKV